MIQADAVPAFLEDAVQGLGDGHALMKDDRAEAAVLLDQLRRDGQAHLGGGGDRGPTLKKALQSVVGDTVLAQLAHHDRDLPGQLVIGFLFMR